MSDQKPPAIPMTDEQLIEAMWEMKRLFIDMVTPEGTVQNDKKLKIKSKGNALEVWGQKIAIRNDAHSKAYSEYIAKFMILLSGLEANEEKVWKEVADKVYVIDKTDQALQKRIIQLKEGIKENEDALKKEIEQLNVPAQKQTNPNALLEAKLDEKLYGEALEHLNSYRNLLEPMIQVMDTHAAVRRELSRTIEYIEKINKDPKLKAIVILTDSHKAEEVLKKADVLLTSLKKVLMALYENTYALEEANEESPEYVKLNQIIQKDQKELEEGLDNLKLLLNKIDWQLVSPIKISAQIVRVAFHNAMNVLIRRTLKDHDYTGKGYSNTMQMFLKDYPKIGDFLKEQIVNLRKLYPYYMKNLPKKEKITRGTMQSQELWIKSLHELDNSLKSIHEMHESKKERLLKEKKDLSQKQQRKISDSDREAVQKRLKEIPIELEGTVFELGRTFRRLIRIEKNLIKGMLKYLKSLEHSPWTQEDQKKLDTIVESREAMRFVRTKYFESLQNSKRAFRPQETKEPEDTKEIKDKKDEKVSADNKDGKASADSEVKRKEATTSQPSAELKQSAAAATSHQQPPLMARSTGALPPLHPSTQSSRAQTGVVHKPFAITRAAYTKSTSIQSSLSQVAPKSVTSSQTASFDIIATVQSYKKANLDSKEKLALEERLKTELGLPSGAVIKSINDKNEIEYSHAGKTITGDIQKLYEAEQKNKSNKPRS